MALQITQMLVPASKYGIKCPYAMDPEGVTIHETGNKVSAMSEISYMIGNNYEVSYHFAVDDKRAVQGLPLNRNGWHAGDKANGRGNRKTIGVEHCYNWNGVRTTKNDSVYNPLYQEALKNGIELVANLFIQYPKWGVPEHGKNIWRHYDHSGKNCPQRLIEEGKWLDYVAKVKARYLELKNGKQSVNSYQVHTTVNGYSSSTDAKDRKNAKSKVSPGTYSVFNESLGMVNVTTKAGAPGNWINPADNKKPATAVNNKGFSISGEAHVQSKGWMSMKNNILGTTGKGLRLEAFNVTVSKDGKLLPISGMVHLQSLGDVKVNTNLFGTVGEKRRLEAVKLNIHANIEYRVHMQYGGWSAWTKNNEWAGSKGKERRIEAIEFRVK